MYDRFIGTRERITQGTDMRMTQSCYSNGNIIFRLQAFCEHEATPVLSQKTQPLKNKKYARELCALVLGQNKETYNLDQWNTDEETFRESLSQYWFVFEDANRNRQGDADNNVQMAATAPGSCNLISRIDPPGDYANNRDDWMDAVAVPRFDTLENAEQTWFNTERINRSKLAIVGYDIYYCAARNGHPESCGDIHSLDDQSIYTPANFDRYTVMKRETYDELCNSRPDDPPFEIDPDFNPDPELDDDPPFEIDSNFDTEQEFINNLHATLKNKGRHFEKEDLMNFHAALKSGYLTILSGMSGTGKSSIVNAYAKALGKNCELKFIPVSPAWTSEYDLLGYYDAEKQKYNSSATGLVEFLREAAANPNRLYLVCLDEMNLARVEHYFSPFLSVLESEDEEKRKIVLYREPEHTEESSAANPGGTQQAAGSAEVDKIPSAIKIGSNVRFVGTVNIDDTTYNFADKVRDRANIINLQVCNYSVLPFKKKDEPEPTAVQRFSFLNHIKGYDALQANQEQDLRTDLWNLHEKLNKASPSFGVSPRTVRAIGTYLANYPGASDDYEKVLDIQINQRVLTKLHGTEQLLKPVLDELDKMSKLDPDPENTGGWKKCKATIKAKREELKNYGYCP